MLDGKQKLPDCRGAEISLVFVVFVVNCVTWIVIVYVVSKKVVCSENGSTRKTGRDVVIA